MDGWVDGHMDAGEHERVCNYLPAYMVDGPDMYASLLWYIYKYIRQHACMHVLPMYACMYVCMDVLMYVCEHICTCMCACTYISIYTYIHIVRVCVCLLLLVCMDGYPHAACRCVIHISLFMLIDRQVCSGIPQQMKIESCFANAHLPE